MLVTELAQRQAEAQARLKRPYTDAEVGDYAAYADLRNGGGKFYSMGGKSYCDMPTMTFEEDEASGYYKRIE